MKIYYYEENTKDGYVWGLTTKIKDIENKNLDYRLATKEDVEEYHCATGKVFSKAEVVEGVFRWKERIIEGEFGEELECEYIPYAEKVSAMVV